MLEVEAAAEESWIVQGEHHLANPATRMAMGETEARNCQAKIEGARRDLRRRRRTIQQGKWLVSGMEQESEEELREFAVVPEFHKGDCRRGRNATRGSATVLGVRP